MSYLSAVYFGAKELNLPQVLAWSEPVFEAFKAGCWQLYWTDEVLYWFAKPTVHVEQMPGGGRRMHNDKYAALESDIENLYFWHGVMVPAFVVVRPDWITVKHIETEENAEVRRIMIERYGMARYLVDSGAKEIHHDDFGTLYSKEIPGDEPLVMVKVVNSTAEPDGSFKDYFLRVPPTVTRAREAVAWTFDVPEEQYEPVLQT